MNKNTLEYAQEHNVRVVCAANRNQHGDIVLGARHFDMLMRVAIYNLKCANSQHPCLEDENYIWEQGFIDQWGRFMTREVALVWATKNGQVNKHDDRCHVFDKLYSENLY